MALLALSLDYASDVRADWVRKNSGGDTALAKRVLDLLAADASSETALRTGGAGHDAADPIAPERVGAYRITGLIGQGGMGAVYRGERATNDFDHTAAIKVVRPGVLSDTLVERFQRERQILATLNHPNIARLYDGGQMIDGSPYMVMEYVEGRSIIDWANDNNSTTTQRLTLFRDLCGAVSYAHQNLIIHRDITPSNVMVTDEGNVKLIDFGIAKPHDVHDGGTTDAASDSLASLSFTPGYAAPERTTGAPANTLSDVFSLGRILGVLIDVPNQTEDIAAIIGRATANDPAARYQSVAALVSDLDNLAGGFPVKAREGGAGYQFGKFFARRKLAVTFGSLAFLGLAGGLATTLFQYQRAEAALMRAEARFDQARALSNSLIFDFYDDFARISGTLQSRKDLADLVRTYIQDLAVDPSAPDDLLLDIGSMSLRLSDIYGGVGVANLGETERAYALLLDAEDKLQTLLARNPDNTEALAQMAMVKRMLAVQSLNYKGDPVAAARYNADTLALASRGAALGGDTERTFLRHFWSARTDNLKILSELENYEEALASVQQWRSELTPEMFDRLGGGEEMAAYMSVQESEFLFELGRFSEAVPSLQYAIGYREAKLAEMPENYYQQTQFMTAIAALSRVYRETGDVNLSRAFAERAVSLARAIMDADAEDAGGPEGLASMLDTLTRVERAAGNWSAAISASDEAIELNRQLVSQFPDTPFYQEKLLQALVLNAQLSLETERRAAACADATEAEQLMKVLGGLGSGENSLGSGLIGDFQEVQAKCLP
ncbi:protein kinase [Hyphomonas johnsonii MHS-2]|uniref:Protein kinase n=2 Tax=Hyphomonas johnsonii TaxID=81031 RepID=A0A059FSF9_9PROT|nr:protein kinase [Hyphomonas johnsonii MHS-2]